jgi:tungstate transport system substrate-binding protein
MLSGGKKLFLPLMALMLMTLAVGCSSTATTTTTTPISTTTHTTTPTTVPTTTPATTKPSSPDMILATTTSTRDTGLLDVLIPMFQTQTGYKVKTVAVGSGAAIALGQTGNADVLLVHSPTDELKFMESGYGINRLLVMHNDFVIVGPPSDPAGIKDMKSATEAMKKIADSKSTFVSRGDKSGTNAWELTVWAKLGDNVSGESWYISTGQGMGATLIVADQKNGYTISDRGTFVAFQKSLSLVIDVDGTQVDPTMINVYHVIQVNPAKFPKVNAAGAKAFSDFMVAPATQQVIASYGVITYGKAVFTPDADKTDAQLGTK